MAADSRKRRLMDGLAPSDAPTAVETPNPAIVNGGADLKRPHVSKSSDSGEPTEDLTGNAFMRPFQNRSLFVALHQERRVSSEALARLEAVEADRARALQALSCIQRHWNQLDRDFAHALAALDPAACADHLQSSTVCVSGPPSNTLRSGVDEILGKIATSHPPLVVSSPTASSSGAIIESSLSAHVEFSRTIATHAIQALHSRLEGTASPSTSATSPIYTHLLCNERQLRGELEAAKDSIALQREAVDALTAQLRAAQEDVRKTHRYIARVLHDNPTLKLSMFGIGSDMAPPVVSTPLDVPAPAQLIPASLSAAGGGLVRGSSMPYSSVGTPVPTPLPTMYRSDSAATAASGLMGGGDTGDATPSVDVKEEGAGEEMDPRATALEHLHIQLSDQSTLAEARLTELTAAYAQLTTLQQEVDRLRLLRPSPKVIQSSPEYLDVANSLSAERLKVAELQRRNEALEMNVKELQGMITMYTVDVKMSDQAAKQAYEQQLDEANAATKRVVAELEEKQVLITLAEARHSENERLHSEVSRQSDLIQALREELKLVRGEGIHSLREAKNVSDAIALLEKKVSRLSGVIREKDSALELMKAQDRETKRVERNTAALIAISTAPDQLSSLAARITSMESDALANDARVTEARSQSAALREEHEKLTSALYAARAETETVKAERVAYEKMVETVSESYESALEKNASLLKEMGELRETITKLQMDVAKGNSLLEGVVKEKEAMEAQVKTGLDIQAALKKLASDATAALSVVRDEAMEKRVVFQGKVGVYAEIEEELIKKMKADVASTSAKVQELEDAVKRIEVLVAERDDSQAQRRRCEEELSRVRKQLVRAEQSAAMAAASASRKPKKPVAETEMDYFRKAVLCSVCHEGIKDRVITKCLHLFCQSCVDENLRSRHRKCPACGQTFGAGDVKPVYLV